MGLWFCLELVRVVEETTHIKLILYFTVYETTNVVTIVCIQVFGTQELFSVKYETFHIALKPYIVDKPV